MNTIKLSIKGPIRAKARHCQWCGWSQEFISNDFKAQEFRAWAAMVRQHEVDCRLTFVRSDIAREGLNAAGEYYLTDVASQS